MEPIWSTQDFIRDVYLSICRDNEELPSREGLDWITKVFRSSKGSGMSIRSTRIGPAGAITLMKRLESNQIVYIDAYDNMLKDTGFMALLKFSERHPTFKRLCVGCNNISTEGCMALAEILQGGTGLEAIELGKPTGYIFAPPRRQGFSSSGTLHNNYVDSSSAARIAKALMYNNTLKYLGLNGNFIGLAGIDGPTASAATKRRFGAASLDTDGPTSIGAMLAVNTTLTALDLSANRLGNSGVTAILRGLGRNGSLLRLDLSRNQMTFITAPMIACIIANPRCVLQELYLSGNPLGLDGAMSIAHGLSCSRSLTTLAVENCALGDDGVSIICAVLSNPLLDINLDKDHFNAFLKRVIPDEQKSEDQDVQVAEYDHMQDFFDKIIESKRNAPNKLVIIRDAAGKIVTKVPIPSKDKGQSVKEPQEFIRFADVSNVGEVIDSVADKTIELLARDTETPTISEMHAAEDDSNFANISDVNIGEKAKQLPLYHDEYNPEEANEIGNNAQSLDDLYSQMEQMAASMGVDSTYVPYIDLQNLKYSNITSLNLSSNGIHEQGIVYFCKLASTRPQFKHINLSYNKLDNHGAILLASSLLCDQLDMNEVISYYTDFERAKLDRPKPTLLDPERVNKNLRSLDLTTCHISDTGFIALAFACLNLPNLVYLNLRDNFIGSKGGDIGIAMLTENKKLTTMIMRGNQVSHASALKLLDVLKRNRRSVTMSVPFKLKQQIAEHKVETQQLNILQEELDFMTHTVTEADSHRRSIQALTEEMVDAFIRQKASLEQKIRQTEDASQIAVESAELQTERIPSIMAQIQQQIANAQANLAEEVLNVSKVEEEYQNIVKKMAEAELNHQTEIEDIEAKASELQQKVKQVEETNKKAEKLVELLRNSYNHIINRAYQSRHLNRTTGAMNPDIMAQVIERMAPVAAGTYTIARPIGYDVTESLLTPPETPPRPTKSAKGKKGKKGAKGKKGKPSTGAKPGTASRPSTTRKSTTPPQTTMPGKRRPQ